MTDVSIDRAMRGLVAILCLPILIYCNAGCGATQMDRARTVLSISGQAMVSVDEIFAPRYAAATEQAREESETFEEYADAIARWNAGATAIAVAASSLRVAESTLDAIDQGMGGDVAVVLACAGVALVDVLDAVSGLVEIPNELLVAIRLLGALAGPRCAAADHATTYGVPHVSEAVAFGGAP